MVQGGYEQWYRALTSSGTGRLRSGTGRLRTGRQTVVQGLPRQAGLGQTGQFWQRLHGLCRRSRNPAACLQLLVSLQNLHAHTKTTCQTDQTDEFVTIADRDSLMSTLCCPCRRCTLLAMGGVDASRSTALLYVCDTLWRQVTTCKAHDSLNLQSLDPTTDHKPTENRA